MGAKSNFIRGQSSCADCARSRPPSAPYPSAGLLYCLDGTFPAPQPVELLWFSFSSATPAPVLPDLCTSSVPRNLLESNLLRAAWTVVVPTESTEWYRGDVRENHKLKKGKLSLDLSLETCPKTRLQTSDTCGDFTQEFHSRLFVMAPWSKI